MVAFSAALAQTVLGLALAGPKNLTELFGPSLSPNAQIILPGGHKWAHEVRQRWSSYQAPTYTGAIKPATVVDIQHIVKIASQNNIPFLATGGGHGISDYRAFEGVAIDLSNFKAAQIDTSRKTVTVGASTEFSQLSRILYDAGKELPLASCPCVGVIGATLGAGIGPLVGRRGLLLDALESVEIVTASGEAVTASSTENVDLFWAIRGAGSSFGIVTSATYRLYDITNKGQVMVADLIYPAPANQSFFQTLQSYDNALPSRMALTGVAVYNRTIEMPLLVLHAVFFGPREEGEKYLEPFQKLGPIASNIAMVPQTALFPADHGACLPNQRINLYTVALKKIHPPSFESFYGHLVDMWHRYPDYEGRLLIERYGKDGTTAVPSDSTAYPWRDAIAHINMENFYSNPTHDDAINAVIVSSRAEFARTGGFGSLATYINFAHGDEGPEAWFSAEKLPKLSTLKRQWDPKGLFSWHNPVPLDWAASDDL
ncbi:hypothetical protein B0H66DRAFT_471114 [Apodospora peruviana]|uniref:FAD-binding PCMH-type domain-containing protein n=1 Tax=Apodospora peruviana TaxID=516989 RepID=A0AAE0IHJ4_9PEZI|nr:hypothetical protein B0H66DRAFT_471114 [Apodospora peruviana]